jgi:uncharacterized damage-inducible protein DinB
MYTTVAELVAEWRGESALTQRVMDALTDASLAQPVSPEGRTLGSIAWHIVTSTPEFLAQFGLTPPGESETPSTVPSTAQAIADAFRKVSGAAADAMEQQLTGQSLQEVQDVFGRPLTKAATVLLLLKHHNHHRGQMTVLMRQAGIKVPGVYGPTKEDWSQMGMEAPL